MSIFEDTLDHYTMHNALTDTNIYYKSIFAIVTLILNLMTQSPIVPFLIFVFCSFIILYKAKISPKFYLTFMAIPSGFAILSVVLLALLGAGDKIIDFGFLGLGISAQGANQGILILFRVLGGVSALAVLILTTPMNRIFTLFHDLHVPQVVTDLAILMYRYIFLFLDVTATMYNSQKTRLGYHNYMSWMNCLASLAGMVFIRTWEQGEVSYNALASRGYNGRLNMVQSGDSIRNISIVNWVLLLIFFGLVIYGIIITGSTNIFPV